MIWRGEAGHAFVLVVRGRLELRAPAAIHAVAAIGPGDYVGEASLLARGPAAWHVVATVDSELLVLGPDDFHDIVGAFPALAAELRATAAGRPDPGLTT